MTYEFKHEVLHTKQCLMCLIVNKQTVSQSKPNRFFLKTTKVSNFWLIDEKKTSLKRP